MTLWHRLLRLFGYQKSTGRLTFSADVELIRALQSLADQEQRPKGELAAELLSFALVQRDVAEGYLLLWRTLSPREQQITALVCLGYTNRQIASRLIISPETVKSHAQHVLLKLGLRSRLELRRALADWDFSTWR